MTQEIQEMLEGQLNDEQTAEVLHRMSVSPEKLTAFRQHMALRGALERDSRATGLTEEEDDAVWAALLGATGGVVTGGASAGASGWFGRAAAFIATGIAGFFIGTAVDGNHAATDLPKQNAATPQQVATLAQSTPAASHIDTVVEYRDRVVYKDKIVYRDRIVSQTTDLADAQKVDKATIVPSTTEGVALNSSNQNRDRGLSAGAKEALTMANAKENTPSENFAALNTLDLNIPDAAPIHIAAEKVEPDPNSILKDASASTDAKKSPSANDDPALSNKAASTVSLLKTGWEIGYSERIGKITPPPAGLKEIDPNFGGRSLDLSYRMLEGRIGVGLRLMYGSFSRVTLEETVSFDLGQRSPTFVPSLQTSKGLGTEIFFNYRLPLFSDKLALGVEVGSGVSSSHYKVGGDLSLLYLITNQIGAQIGAGYSGYWYSTQEVREDALQRDPNAGITSGLNDIYRGTMLEGRYGLFFRF